MAEHHHQECCNERAVEAVSEVIHQDECCAHDHNKSETNLWQQLKPTVIATPPWLIGRKH